MDNRIIVIAFLFILFIVLCLDHFALEEFQIISQLPYHYVDPKILEARNTGKYGEIHRGELKNLQSGDEIQAIKVLSREGGEKLPPMGFDGKGPHSVDISYHQQYQTDYPVIRENRPETTQALSASAPAPTSGIVLPITTQTISI
jgi:hypothetical protein